MAYLGCLRKERYSERETKAKSSHTNQRLNGKMKFGTRHQELRPVGRQQRPINEHHPRVMYFDKRLRSPFLSFATVMYQLYQNVTFLKAA